MTPYRQVRAEQRLTVSVPAVPATRYDVVVRSGALDDVRVILEAAGEAASYAVIAADSVAWIYADRVCSGLRAHGMHAALFTFADGEKHKTRDTWASLTDAMLAAQLGRDCCVIAVGGGVAGDVAGFVAATYMRGVPVVQVPTTLLAMIDASVGGKTGVDTSAGKNLVGSFHAPRLVLIDPLVLRTLPDAELRAGMAEAIKHGAILDDVYFGEIERHAERLLELDAALIERLVARSVQLKAQVVAEDPLEAGRRAILNFGHTVAHAVERSSGYSLRHGAAVATGMAVEASIGEALGITEAGTSERIAALVRRFGLPDRMHTYTSGLIDAMRVDKKARRSEVRLALLRRIGEAAPSDDGSWTHAVEAQVLEAVLRQHAERVHVV